MADEQLIKPRELNPALAVYSDDAIMTDDGVTVSRATPVQIVDAGAPVATEAEAIAGTDNTKRMTPLGVRFALENTSSGSVAAARAWAESDTTPDPAIPGSKSSKTWALESERHAADAYASAESAKLSSESSQWFFDTKSDAEVRTFVGDAPKTVYLRGWDSVGDGQGGMFILGGVSSRSLNIDGHTYGFSRDVSPNRIARAKHEKWLITSDWQPVPSQAADIEYMRSFLDGLEQRHPDIDFVAFPGDLVDRATENGTGALPSYGYAEFRRDIEQRMPSVQWDRWFFLPGNHDRDGTGLGQHKYAWSYETYRRYIGPEFYSISKGNIVQIFLGDMAGSNSGEVMDWALKWFRNTLEISAGKNIIVWMHQPLHGVHPSSLSEDSTWSQIDGGTRLAPLLEEFAPQILFVGYGHVGFGLDTGATVTDLYGCTHINFSLAIPSLRNSGFSVDGVYSTMQLQEGDGSVTIQRWNATTHEYIPGYDVVVTSFVPLQLGRFTFDSDGRNPDVWYKPVLRGPMNLYGSVGDYRTYDGASWVSPTNSVVPLLTLSLADDQYDAMGQGGGSGIMFDLPGKVSQDDDQGNAVNGQNSYGLGGGFAIRRGGSARDNYEGYASILVRPFGGGPEVSDLEQIATFMPTTKGAGGAGLNVYNGGRIRVSTPTDFDPASVGDTTGIILRENGHIVVSRNGTNMVMQRQSSNGALIDFHRGTARVGTISVTETATAYNTTSDATLKTDERPLTFEEACEIIQLVTIYDYKWISTGERDIGPFAQELHKVYPAAVTVGGFFDEEGNEVSAANAGAKYQPWAVDHSKLVPVMMVALQGVLSRIIK